MVIIDSSVGGNGDGEKLKKLEVREAFFGGG